MPLPVDDASPKRAWTKARVLTAQLIAEGELTYAQIAVRVKKSEGWLFEQKRLPWFKARIASLVEELAEDARRIGIANQRTRLLAQNERWLAMHQVISERATHQRTEAEPGGSTGLLMEELKGPFATPVYLIDTGLLSELRALEAQVAKELGQSAEKPREGGDTYFADKILIVRNVPELGT